MTVESNSNSANFNTISPSAKALLLLKGYTPIPFARQAAELAISPEQYVPDFTNMDRVFWARVMHFENRYWSIDQLLNELSPANVLELSSGFSFRGLDMVKQHATHYIDTDLPDLIETKQGFVKKLQENATTKGKLEILPLNVLDENQFAETVSHFGQGEIVIVNEGLLMYLNLEEKEKLCSIIHSLLVQRGGYWITADIYVKTQLDNYMKPDAATKAFAEQHHIEDNKFESFEAAADFFKKAGFVVDKEAEPDHKKLTSLGYLIKNVPEQERSKLGKIPKIRATWRLKPF